MIKREILNDLYVIKKFPVTKIAKQLECSQSRINYWIKKHGIKKRSISAAMYLHKNPEGDPFEVQNTNSKNDYFLMGLGIGLYWGEGTKSDKNAVRLGNSDPYLINMFLHYLEKIYAVSRERCNFGLQIFEGMDIEKELYFWQKFLNVPYKNFYKTMVKEKRGNGTYKKIVEHGVLTIYFNNTKLRNIIINNLEKLRKIDILTNVL